MWCWWGSPQLQLFSAGASCSLQNSPPLITFYGSFRAGMHSLVISFSFNWSFTRWLLGSHQLVKVERAWTSCPLWRRSENAGRWEECVVFRRSRGGSCEKLWAQVCQTSAQLICRALATLPTTTERKTRGERVL